MNISVDLWLLAWLVLAIFQAGLFIYQYKKNDAGIVDAGWAAGMGFLACYAAWFSTGDETRRIVFAVMAALWSLRLALHLFINRVLPPEEDGRYAMLRQSWGEKTQLYFFVFFQVQAAWSILFAIPFVVVAGVSAPWGSATDWLAVLIWLISITGESIADWQLESWKSKETNRGKTCRSGLWKYSRHPNYFFEWLHWWTYVALAATSELWYVSLAGPLIMLIFLYKLTGIPYTEKRALAHRGDDYRNYQQTTSAFFPWFPKEKESKS